MKRTDDRATLLNGPILPRRDFLTQALIAAGGISALGLSACQRETTPSKDQPHSGKTLRVFVYSGAWEKGFREHFVPQFEARTGARVIVDPGWWDSIPKLKASTTGQPAFDLVLTDATQGFPAIKEGMFRSLDMTRIPNRHRLASSALDNWVVREGYGITFPESAMTLGYHKDMVAKAPTSWGDLLEPMHSGKIGLYNSFYMSLYTFACMKVASEGRAGRAFGEMKSGLQGVIDFAKRERDRVKLWWPTSTDMALNLSQRNVALGNMHSPDMLPALKSNPKLGALVPREDRAFVLLMWVVSQDSRVKDLAEEAIDFLFSDEVQRGLARSGQATANLEVAAEVAAEDPVWASIYPSTEQAMQGLQYYPYDVYLEHWEDLVRVWDREILRKG